MSKIENIKNHVRENKKVYIVGGVCFLAGVATTIIVVKKADVEISPKIQQILSYKPHATLEVYVEALGDPGNIVQDTTTGTIYASQNQAAKALGTTPSRMSSHLKGDLEHIDGHVLVKLGKAMVAPLEAAA